MVQSKLRIELQNVLKGFRVVGQVFIVVDMTAGAANRIRSSHASRVEADAALDAARSAA